MSIREKRKYLRNTHRILNASLKEKMPYKIRISGKDFIVYPYVFSPKYFKDSEFFCKELPIDEHDEFLEIGCGTGVISIFSVWKGASKAVAIDIDPKAVKNARENVKLHNLENKITVLCGHIFNPVKGRKFDKIFWNTPFCYVKKDRLPIIERSVFDTKYKSISEFIKKAKDYLKLNGRLFIGFSSTMGHISLVRKFAKAEGYKLKLVKEINSIQGHSVKYPVKFQIYELKIA